jgi:hypothetical protein
MSKLANADISSHCKRQHLKRNIITVLYSRTFSSDLLHCAFRKKRVACSTKIALEWDEAFKNMNDPSGRAVAMSIDSYVRVKNILHFVI